MHAIHQEPRSHRICKGSCLSSLREPKHDIPPMATTITWILTRPYRVGLDHLRSILTPGGNGIRCKLLVDFQLMCPRVIHGLSRSCWRPSARHDTFIHCYEQSYLLDASRPTYAGRDCCTVLLVHLIEQGIRPRTWFPSLPSSSHGSLPDPTHQ